MREDVTQLDNSEAFDVNGDDSIFLNEQERGRFTHLTHATHDT